ncbi:hypothetical protein AURDEDRAFT_115108 [Auricularia subglabra TFB-10046 SS5]|nr:hypothetical protein AURDEDRAFT_115108 [Auricularia subglabra TFB-10046 SS5]
MRIDFALAAHEQYGPLIRMVISDRTDFVGKTADEIFATLEEERRSDPQNEHDRPSVPHILLVTEDTVRSAHTDGEEIEVVYIECWPHLEYFGEKGEYLVPEARAPRDPNDTSEDPVLNFTLRLRIELHYAPILWANLDICNMAIPEMLESPFNPFQPLPPPEKQSVDWRKETPYPPTVVASPKSHERREISPPGKLLGGPQPQVSYRLTREAADELGIIPEWTSAWHDNDQPEGTMTFSQQWKPRPLPPF